VACGIWRLHAAVKKEDGSPATLWRVEAPSKDDPLLLAARKTSQRLRTLRHPGLVRLRDAGETDGRGGGVVVWLATEPVTPAWAVLEGIGATMSGLEWDEYAAMGLKSVFSATAFLNNDCQIIHGGLCAGAVFVTPEHDWKLGMLDTATEHAAAGECPRALPHTHTPRRRGPPRAP